ncbi:MAG: hypothetical protein PHE17_01190 [Thiothrix sp.]|uniref:hypothetical protein n=1 Tax=Thiothrix sp. TaxID=1032 RepID=UPI002635754E|nr:hypothetical protein [Thiothrix sp.]MDD5391610.1 hypothetical protein [Thiothrix sp.]
MDNHTNSQNTTELMNQLDRLLTLLLSVPESERPSNAAYYLAKLARYTINRGADYPMIASVWSHGDFEDLTEEEISSDRARKLFALIDRTHNAEIGINWDVLNAALDVY